MNLYLDEELEDLWLPGVSLPGEGEYSGLYQSVQRDMAASGWTPEEADPWTGMQHAPSPLPAPPMPEYGGEWESGTVDPLYGGYTEPVPWWGNAPLPQFDFSSVGQISAPDARNQFNDPTVGDDPGRFLAVGQASHPDELEPQQEYASMIDALRYGVGMDEANAIAQSHLTAHEGALAGGPDPFPGEPQKNENVVEGFRNVIGALGQRRALADSILGQMHEEVQPNYIPEPYIAPPPPEEAAMPGDFGSLREYGQEAGILQPDYSGFTNPIPWLEGVQDVAGDIGSLLTRPLAYTGGAIGAPNVRPSPEQAEALGRLAGEALVPTSIAELGFELLPGAGMLPGAAMAARSGTRALGRGAASYGRQVAGNVADPSTQALIRTAADVPLHPFTASQRGPQARMMGRPDAGNIDTDMLRRNAKIREALDAYRAEAPQEELYLRWDEGDYKPGDRLPPSRKWADDEPTDELLNGTSVLDPRYDQHTRGHLESLYMGDVYLVRGLPVGRGVDAGEVILQDAEVVKKLSGEGQSKLPPNAAQRWGPAGRPPFGEEPYPVFPPNKPEQQAGAAARSATGAVPPTTTPAAPMGAAPSPASAGAPPPDVPPTGVGDVLPPEPPKPEDIAAKLIDAVKTARRLTPEQRAQRSAELGNRVAGFARVMESATTAEDAMRARGMLRGELPRVTFDAPALEEAEWDTLFRGVAQTKKLPPLSRNGALDALADLRTGQIPQPAALEKLERVYPGLGQAVSSKRATGTKLWDEVVGLLGIPQAMQTFLDASGTLRQALVVGLGHPSDFWQAIKREAAVLGAKPLQAGAKSQKFADELMENPWVNGVDHPGLSFEEVGGHTYSTRQLAEAGDKASGFTSLNNSVISKYVQKIPGMSRSQEGMVTLLNNLGARVYAREAQTLWDMGIRDRAQYEALARVINHGRGYGSIRAPDLVKGVNAFFSPRYLSSRVEMFTDPFNELRKGNKSAARLAAQNLVGFVSVNTAMLELLNQTGVVDVGWNPLDTDFGKARIGDLRIDPWAGASPLARLVARTGALVANEMGIDTGYKYQGGPGELIKDFLGGKLGPIPRILAEQMGIADKFSDAPGLLSAEQAFEMFTPFLVQSIRESIEKGGLGWKGALIAGPTSFLGTGTLAYATPTEDRNKGVLAAIKAGQSYKAADGTDRPLPTHYTDKDGNQKPVESFNDLKAADPLAAEAWLKANPDKAPQSFDDVAKRVEEIKAQHLKDQEGLAPLLRTDPALWRESSSDRAREAQIRIDEAYQARGDYDRPPQTLLDMANQKYHAAIEAAKANGLVNWRQVDQSLAGFSQEERDLLFAQRLAGETPERREYIADLAKLDDYFNERDAAWAQFQTGNPGLQKFASLDDYRTFLVNDFLGTAEKPSGLSRPMAKQMADRAISVYAQQAALGGLNYLIQNPDLIGLLTKYDFAIPSMLAPMAVPQPAGSGVR